MKRGFYRCKQYIENILGPINKWNVSNVQDMSDLFDGLNNFHNTAKFCLSDKQFKKQKRNDYED